MSAAIAPRDILVVLAHPDDESFICGGTLARYAADGHRITLICATRGEMGRRLGVPPLTTREGLPRLREQELRAACVALGISDLRFLGLRDKTLDYYDPQALAAHIIPVMEELHPAAVITFHEAIGGHSDHCAIGRATRLAWERSGGGARLYYLLWSGDAALVRRAGSTPDRVTAIAVKGAAATAKMRAFRAHRTQSALMDWLRSDKTALKRLSGREFFLQGSGPARPGESDILP
jgi:bacillithiol biosynthesis deacetylase BshB2